MGVRCAVELVQLLVGFCAYSDGGILFAQDADDTSGDLVVL